MTATSAPHAPALPLPTISEPRTDWGSVWAVLQAAQDGTAGPYTATPGDTRRFTLWARHHHGCDVYYRTTAPGAVVFQLARNYVKKAGTV